MTDNSLRIDLGLDAEGRPSVIIGSNVIDNMADLLRKFPLLRAPEQAIQLARAVSHLSAHSGEYKVIADPLAYEKSVRERLATEDAAMPYQDGKPRIGDFGLPDFGTITPPHYQGDTLIFFVEDVYLHTPSRAAMTNPAAEPVYEPMPLIPVDPG